VPRAYKEKDAYEGQKELNGAYEGQNEGNIIFLNYSLLSNNA
jgi:hypothetical protein